MSVFYNKDRLAIDLATIIGKSFGMEYPDVNKYIMSIDPQKQILSISGIGGVNDQSLIKIHKELGDKIFLGKTGYFSFGDILGGEVTQNADGLYNITLPFYKIEDYKNYITDLNKDISLLILSFCYGHAALRIIRAFDEPYTETDYKVLSKVLYPRLYPMIEDVIKDGPKEEPNIWGHGIWEQIFLALISSYPNESLNKVGLSSIEKDIKLLSYYNDLIKGNFHNIITKLLVKLKYPYLYSQIKDTYTLEQFGKDRIDIPHGYTGLNEYLRTGNISNIDAEDLYGHGFSLTTIALVLRDGFIPSDDYLVNIISNVGSLISYSKGGPEFFTVFNSLYDFLVQSKIPKDILKKLLPRISAALFLTNRVHLDDINRYINS